MALNSEGCTQKYIIYIIIYIYYTYIYLHKPICYRSNTIEWFADPINICGTWDQEDASDIKWPVV